MRIKKKDLLLNLFIICIMTYYTFSNSAAHRDVMKILLALGAGFGAVRILSSLKINVKTAVVFLITGGIISYHFLLNADSRLLMAFIAMLCMVGKEPEEVIGCMFYTKLLAFLTVQLLGGYEHINLTGLHGSMVVLLFICKYGDMMNLKHYLLITVSIAALILYTGSGAVIVGLCSVAVLLLIIRTKAGRRVCCSKITVIIYPLCLFLNWFLVLGVNENRIPFVGDRLPGVINSYFMKFVATVDYITSSRLALAEFSYRVFGISLLGGNVDNSRLNLHPGQYFNLDSGMIWLVQGWGILMSIVFMILTVLLMKYLIQTKRYYYVIAGIVIALWSLNEDMLVSAGTNFLIIFMGPAIQNRKGVRIHT